MILTRTKIQNLSTITPLISDALCQVASGSGFGARKLYANTGQQRQWQRYYFSLKNGRPFHDVDGLELPDLDAARTEAVGLT